jgi:hypothetical protein
MGVVIQFDWRARISFDPQKVITEKHPKKGGAVRRGPALVGKRNTFIINPVAYSMLVVSSEPTMWVFFGQGN